MKSFAVLCLLIGSSLSSSSAEGTNFSPGASARAKPREIVLIEPNAVTARNLKTWRNEGFNGVAVVLDEQASAQRYAEAATMVASSGLDLYYWIEIARNPAMAERHPEWMASLGMHNDWQNRFPNARLPRSSEVAKAFPWVAINYREAFAAHLERIENLLKQVPPAYRGVLLNDLQGGPASCGCGNLQCRWATDYQVAATGTAFGTNDVAARFVAEVARRARDREIVPIWTTECDDEDLPKEKRAGEWTTEYSGSIGCAVGSCPKVFTQQFSALAGAHRGAIGLLALHREFGRVFPQYGGPAAWVERTVDYVDRTLPKNGGQTVSHDRFWLVVQGYAVSTEEEKAARLVAAKTGVSAVVVARTRIDQSYRPRSVSVKAAR